MKKYIFFFLPSFENNSGHENSFVNTLIKVSKKTKNDYYFLLPFSNKIKIKKYNFFYKSQNFFLKIRNIFLNTINLNKVLKNKDINQKTLFVDGFSLFDLMSIYLSSEKMNFNLIIYIRHYYKNKIKYFIFNLLIKKLKKKNK